MKRILLLLIFIASINFSNATIHVIRVENGNFQFTPQQLSIDLGDTVEWRKADFPTMMHTITSTDIPAGAAFFNYIWQAPADTFFQYVPTVPGLYDYECTPHAQQFNMMGYFEVNLTTGLNDNGTQLPVHVSPNPAADQLMLINLPERTVVDYRILDLNGKIIISGNHASGSRMDVSTLKEGVYFIELLYDRPQTIRFIKQ